MCATESAHRFSPGFTQDFRIDSGNHSKSPLGDIFYHLFLYDIPVVGLHVLFWCLMFPSPAQQHPQVVVIGNSPPPASW